MAVVQVLIVLLLVENCDHEDIINIISITITIFLIKTMVQKKEKGSIRKLPQWNKFGT